MSGPGGMDVVIFGATGMVGQGVLRECLGDPGVRRVLAVGRTPTGLRHPRLEELVRADLFDYADVEPRLAGFDACFFCLGVSSAGMALGAYERITYGITLAAAGTLARLNPGMTFVYVTGAGTDSSERGRSGWARIKGKTENALLRLPFKAAYMFRPGAIEPAHGERSKTPGYRLFYAALGWLLPLLRRVLPQGMVVTTEQIGRAMLAVARQGAPGPIVEARDIASLGGRPSR
jgi:uncharacterized protein YbjT (DUF2867 family)